MQKPISLEFAELKPGEVFVRVTDLRRAVQYMPDGKATRADLLELLDLMAKGEAGAIDPPIAGRA